MQIITTHLSADFDSLASMVAARRLYPEASLVFSGSAEPALQEYLRTSGLDGGIVRVPDVDLERVTRLIVVDTQDPRRLGVFGALVHKAGVEVAVFDHHPEADGPGLQAQTAVIRKRGACTTVLFEELRARNLTLKPEEATLLLVGLYQDTHSLTSAGTTPEDLEAAAALLRAGADLGAVAAFLAVRLNTAQVAVLNDLIAHLEIGQFNGVPIGLAMGRIDPYVPDLAVVVARLRELENLDAVFAVVAHEKRVIVIGRSGVEQVDVGVLLRFFGGGGHPQAGSANISERTPEQVLEELRRLLEERVAPPRQVLDIMHAPVISVSEKETLDSAEKRMTRFNVNTLPVVVRKKPVGLITRQMVEKALHHKLGREQVGHVMSREFASLTPEAPFKSVVPIIVEDKQTLVPVVAGDKGHLVGVVSRGDLLRYLHLCMPYATPLLEPGQIVHKDIKSLMAERLPRPVMHLLGRVARLANAQDASVYVVGGFVRDLLLDIENLDIDLVVEGDGLRFARELGRELDAHVVSHQKFGTSVLVLPDGFRIDVATARAEFYRQPAALPTVEPGSIKLDLFRRDFTFNSMAIRLNGRGEFRLIDFFNGQRDLKEGRVRVLHNLSFVEDPTRAFRAVRFEQRLGFCLGKQTEAFLRHAVRKKWIGKLSGHRLFNELAGMLREKRPLGSIKRMKELDLLQFIHPALLNKKQDEAILERVERVLSFSSVLKSIGQPETWKVYLLALLWGLDAAGFRKAALRLGLTGKLRETLKTDLNRCRYNLERLKKKKAPGAPEIYKLFSECSPESAALIMAVADSEQVNRAVLQFYTQYRDAAELALTGDDLIRLGLKPGPVFQTVFKTLREARLNGQVRTREEEEALVRRRFLCPE